MNKKTSIYDIAQVLNISASTVSRALKNHPGISEETRLQVQRVARELNYRPNTLAVGLKRGRSQTLGVIVPNINRNFFSSAIEGMEEEAYKAGYDVLIWQSKDSYEREKKIVDSLSRGKVDGVIVSLGYGTRDFSHFNYLLEEHIPLVFFDRTVDGVADATVSANDYQGGYRMVKHLLGQGYRRIFHYASYLHVSVWRNRYLGYVDALKEAGITPEEEWVTIGEIRQEDGEEYARRILEMKEKPDAVFCTSDYVALGMLTELAKNGCRVPGDIAVAGYANESFGEIIQPSLSSVNQYSKKMGREAARLVIARLNGEVINNVVLEPELMIRESTLKMVKE